MNTLVSLGTALEKYFWFCSSKVELAFVGSVEQTKPNDSIIMCGTSLLEISWVALYISIISSCIRLFSPD